MKTILERFMYRKIFHTTSKQSFISKWKPIKYISNKFDRWKHKTFSDYPPRLFPTVYIFPEQKRTADVSQKHTHSQNHHREFKIFAQHEQRMIRADKNARLSGSPY